MRGSQTLGAIALLVHAAVALLPPEPRERYTQEWLTEAQILSKTKGRLAALRFALGLIPAAFRVTRALRAGSETAYLEIGVASLTALPSTFVLSIWAITSGDATLLAAQAAIAAGIFLFAFGIWRSDGLLMSSRAAQAGLLLVVSGSAVGTVILQAAELPYEQVASTSASNTVVVVGLALLMLANYTGSFRAKVQRGSLLLLIPGAALTFAVAVLNAREATGLWRIAELIYALPVAALAWACLSILGRAPVFSPSN